MQGPLNRRLDLDPRRSRLARVAVALLLLAPGCAWVLRPFRGIPPALVAVDPRRQPTFTDDLDLTSLRRAIEQSITFYDQQATALFTAGARRFTGADWARAMRGFLARLETVRNDGDLDRALWLSFDLLRATGEGRPIRFTGYYTPRLHGSLDPEGPYRYPLYAKPPDLLTFDMEEVYAGCDCATGVRVGRLENGMAVPYYSRSEIDAGGALRRRGLEIAWTDDPIALFFLHMQGSGQLVLADGRDLHINFAATNGLPFRSIGRILGARGELPPGGGSMQTVRHYLEQHPAERDAILHENPRYTFFVLGERGPFGSTEVELTSGRSIATDPTVFPPGALAYVRTRVPVVDAEGNLTGWEPLQRLVLNQDSGAAIKGPTRVDFYFGTGDQAGAVAGRMAANGDLFFFAPPAAAAVPTHLAATRRDRLESPAGFP